MSIARLASFKPMAVIGFLTFVFIYVSWGELNDLLKQTSYYSMATATKVDININDSKLSLLQFHSSYHIKGYLRLPRNNLNEPIEVWYNKKHSKSRIDYYNGLVKTYQDGQYGVGGLLVRIIPKYNSIKKIHSIGCWKKVGKKPGQLKAQSIIPTNWSWPFKGTLDSFKYVGEEIIKDKLCSKWEYSHQMYEKYNIYTFWITKTDPPEPIRYEMNGYDTLLTSYYDKYIIDYTYFEKWEFDKKVFEIPQIPNDNWCLNASKLANNSDGLNDSDGGEYSLNPMAEFVSSSHEDDPIEPDFHRYKKRHGKVYGKEEHSKRKHLYRHNARFINSVNRQNHNYKLKLNSFADLTDEEYKRFKGALPDKHQKLKREKRSKHNLIHENYKPRKHSPEIPDELDWRDFGAVTGPRGQGTCGSCWAFAAVGAMEGANFIKTGKLVELSEQQLMDCTWKVEGLPWNTGNSGCHGGWAWKAMFWGRSNKLATREGYGPYLGQEGYCKIENLTAGIKMHGFRRVKKWNPTALRKAIAYHGPAAVSINSHPLTLKFYSSGILDDKSCNNSTDHAVLVVGYGRENGTNYWLVKNSWSTLWGDGGYVKIKENVCGITKKPVVVYNTQNKPYPWKKNGQIHRHTFNHKKKFRNYKRWWTKMRRRRRRRRRWHRHAARKF